jgi:hypothetical protein
VNSSRSTARRMRLAIALRFRNSATPQTLARLGYRLDSTPTIYRLIDPRWQSPGRSRPLCVANLIEAKYLNRTPLSDLCGLMGYDRGAFFKFAFREAMTRGAAQEGPPIFQFRHVLSPHPPFMLDTHGDPVEPSDWAMGDANEFLKDDPKRRELYLSGYANQVQGLNVHLLEIIDRLLKSPRPIIIILHGDHGSGFNTSHANSRDTCLWERYSPLLAVYSSDGRLQPRIPDDVSLVNVFRIVFGTYFGSNSPLLPNRSFYAPFDDLTKLEQVEASRSCDASDPVVAHDESINAALTNPTIRLQSKD